jgi:hypothetical protein
MLVLLIILLHLVIIETGNTIIIIIIITNDTINDLAKTQKNEDLFPYPDLFIIGVQKCGTTSLNKLLFEHPQICNEGKKEKHFYSERDYLSASMLQEYRFQFSHCKQNQISVDATPAYASKPEAAERINSSYAHTTLSKKKFIILLREPVSRHYSEYERNLRICFRAIDGDEELDRDSSSRTAEEKLVRAEMRCHVVMRPGTNGMDKKNAYSFAEWTASPFGAQELRRGRYLSDLKRWLTFIDRSQIFVVNFEGLLSNTTDVMKRLSSFLQLDPKFFLNDPKNPDKILLPPPPPSNVYVQWDGAYMDCATFENLNKYFKRENDGLYDFINNVGNKPKQEPTFSPFTSKKSNCTKNV